MGSKLSLASLPSQRVLEQWSLPRLFRRNIWDLAQAPEVEGAPFPPILECLEKVLGICTNKSLVMVAH